MCGNKCKCVDCLNYVGSQALIDKRRKIKDHRGADFAMRIADEAWKGKSGAPAARASGTPVSSSRLPAPAPAAARPSRSSHGQHMPPGPSPHQMRAQSPASHHHSHAPRGPPPGGPAPSYMSHHSSMGRAPVGYPAYHIPQQGRPGFSQNPTRSGHQHAVDSRVRVESRSGEPQLKGSKSEQGGSDEWTGNMQRPKDANPIESTPAPMKPEDITAAVASKLVQASTVSTKSRDTVGASAAADSQSASKHSHVVSTPAAAPKPLYPISTPVNITKSKASMANIEPDDTPRAPPHQATATPRTPGVRLGYDPTSSKKKRQLRPGQNEATFPYFGNTPEQPKTTALAVLSFLSNDEIYNAALVCKQWNALAMDEELWQF